MLLVGGSPRSVKPWILFTSSCSCWGVRLERCCASPALDEVFPWWRHNRVDPSTLNSLATFLYEKDATSSRKSIEVIALSMQSILVELSRVKDGVQNGVLMLVAHRPPRLIGCPNMVSPVRCVVT
jgi:hypothetical protein